MPLTALSAAEVIVDKQRVRRRNMLPAHRFRVRQRSHFLICVAIPTLLALLMPIALSDRWLFIEGIAILIVMWLFVGGVGVSVGLHRHFSHRAFAAKPILRAVMAIFGCMAGQGSVSYWVALHRSHHTHSDQPGDLHSPVPAAHGLSSRWISFLHGHFGWVWHHDVPSPSRYAVDLINDRLIARIDGLYSWFVMSGILIPGLAGIAIWGGFNGFLIGAYWGGFLRMAIGHQIIWSINSICHFSGQSPYDTGDHSRNVGWLSILSFGESWHNNHHFYPTSAMFKHRWWQIDLGWAFICLVARLKLASNVKRH
jgi:stearoyl-CoA desaturase (delta-9 desaturase)